MYNTNNIEHPDITAAERTGYPRGYKESTAYICPICHKEPTESVFVNYCGDVIGCDLCAEIVEPCELIKNNDYTEDE